MKIIHCADIHLGSKMEAKLPKEKADERRREVRESFHRLVEFAREESVSLILLCGDVFDSDRPLKRDKEFFYEVIKGNPDIEFLYLRGNHDGEEAYEEDDLPNLKTFSKEWTGYDYDGVHICGLELCKENALSMYSTLRLEKDKKNIVMLHGQISASAGEDKIQLSKFADKNMDYLALGHIHSYAEGKLDERGRYAYSGCLEGRGFDEIGEKGFVVLELGEGVKFRFLPFSKRVIEERTVDISDAENIYDAYKKVGGMVEFNPLNLYRIYLTGEICFDNETLAADVERLLKKDCYFVSVKDKTLQKITAEDYVGDVSLRGEFVRTVLANTEWSDERKKQVLALGLRTLKRGEVE